MTIESTNFGIVSYGTKTRKGKKLPKKSGNFTTSTNLRYLIRQLPTINKKAPQKLRKDGSLYMTLSSLQVDPKNKGGLKNRLAFYNFDVDDDTQIIFINAVVTKQIVKALENYYLDILKEENKDPKKTVQQLIDTPVLIEGNYDDVDALTTGQSKGTMSLFLRYVRIEIGTGRDKIIFASFEPESMRGYLNDDNEFIELNRTKKGADLPKGKTAYNVYRMSDEGENAGSISGMTTLSFLKNFALTDGTYRNLRSVTTKDGSVFVQVSVGSINWKELPINQKLQFPDEIYQQFEKMNIENVDFRYIFGENDFVDGKAREGSIIDQVNKFKSHDKLIGYTASLSLDFDKKSHVSFYHSEKHDVNNATIMLHRPTFFTIKNLSVQTNSEN